MKGLAVKGPWLRKILSIRVAYTDAVTINPRDIIVASIVATSV